MEFFETDRNMGTVHAVVHKLKKEEIEDSLSNKEDYVVVDLTAAAKSNDAQDIIIETGEK